MPHRWLGRSIMLLGLINAFLYVCRIIFPVKTLLRSSQRLPLRPEHILQLRPRRPHHLRLPPRSTPNIWQALDQKAQE